MAGTGKENRPPEWLEQIDHTADVGITVRAHTLPQLFARAAWGMFSLITDVEEIRELDSEEITVIGDDREELLLRWLSDLNFRHITTHRLFGRFEILEATGRELRARVFGEKIDPARHTIYTEIKAVTYHGLVVEERDGEWQARIIFDL